SISWLSIIAQRYYFTLSSPTFNVDPLFCTGGFPIKKPTLFFKKIHFIRPKLPLFHYLVLLFLEKDSISSLFRYLKLKNTCTFFNNQKTQLADL
ncbi:hypothetical protein, partial [Myroides odoratimimus]|uniref:hypothetical protein n=1 Tax=Myroides odoratimimus TaxID=76832 RepID=UPI0025760EDC